MKFLAGNCLSPISLLVLAFVCAPQPVRSQPSFQQSDATSALCADGECKPAISATTYFARRAYRLTDGRTEAIIVPQIGRIMSYGKVGGPNLLWNSPTTQGVNWGWKNYGGDKSWLGPQSAWPMYYGKAWPPDTAHDGTPHNVEILSGGKVQMTSPLSVTGIRFIRTMYFASNGEFVIEQTARKEKGPLVRASIWSITQAVPGQAVFLPMHADSVYKKGYLQLQGKKPAQTVDPVRPNLLRVMPTLSGDNIKIGIDSLTSSIASVRDGVAFLQKAPTPKGNYPDGADIAGCPVELYINSDPKLFYYEMELLGPLKNFVAGSKSTHTVRWSLHDLPSGDMNSAEVLDAVETLLYSGEGES